MAERVKIVEVGPRDGLQNEKQPVDPDIKIGLIERLVAAGLGFIEAASFVSPKWVPQMAGSAELMQRIPAVPGVVYSALTPNLKGLESAIASGCKDVAVFAAASELFSQKNINCTIHESLERFVPVMETAHKNGVTVRGYVSCVLACPYEGSIDPQKVAEVASELYGMGCYEISLGDTIGQGTPDRTKKMLEACLKKIPADHLAGHFHDTYGMAIANIVASLEMGLRCFDSSVAGLGGCPYAHGASGNVASEDVVYLLKGMGFHTGIDLPRLIAAGEFISGVLGRENASRVARAMRPCDTA